jgi:hypothetical protein
VELTAADRAQVVDQMERALEAIEDGGERRLQPSRPRVWTSGIRLRTIR